LQRERTTPEACAGPWGQRPAGRRAPRALAAALTCLAACVPPASARDAHADAAPPEPAAAGTLRVGEALAAEREFDLPAQPLGAALAAFARQTGLRLRPLPDELARLEAPAVRGRLAPEEALRRLLAGTGLDFRLEKGGTVVVTADARAAEEAPPVPTIVVRGERRSPFGPGQGYRTERSATAARLDVSLADTPAAIQVLPRQALEDAGASRVADGLELAAGVQETNTFGNTSDGFLLRGFDATFAEDGVVSDGAVAAISGQRDAAVVDRIEVLRGPASALYGQASPGGIINVITKRPRRDDFFQTDTVVSSFERYRQEFDANAAPGPQDRVQARLSGAVELFDSYRDHVDGDRQVASPAITFEPDDRWTVAFRGEYLRDAQPFDRGVPLAADGKPLADEEAYFGDPDDGDTDTQVGRTQLEVEYDFAERWTGRLFGAWTWNSLEGTATEPRGIAPLTLPPAIIEGDTILRQRRVRDQETKLLTTRAEVSGELDTGPIAHEVLLSGELRRLEDDRVLASTSLFGDLDFVRISDPVIDTPDVEPSFSQEFEDEVTNGALIAFDRIEIWKPLSILVGGRVDFVEQRSRTESVGVEEAHVEEVEFSPTVGVVARPTEWASLFFRYAQSFEVNTEEEVGSGLLDPQDGESLEGGVRLELRDGDLAATLTAFRTHLENVPVPDVANPGFAFSSSQRSRGLELVLQGAVTDALSLVWSYTFTDSEVDDLSGVEGSSDLQGVPRHEAGLFADYSFQRGLLAGLSLRAGVFYTGERLNSLPQQTSVIGIPFEIGGKELDPYVRVDVGAGYRIRDWLRASFKVENLFDKRYELPSIPDFALPGAPRVFSGRISLRF